MALDANTIRKWVGGATAKSRSVDAESDDDDLPIDETEEADEPEVRNQLWAGEVEDGQEITPEQAGEFVGWLEENEPEIADAVFELAETLTGEDPDPRMIAHARQELMTVNQYLDPEYPTLTPEQRKLIDQQVMAQLKAAGLPERGSPEWDTAVATAVLMARKPKVEEAVEEDEEGLGKPPAKKPPFPAKKPAFGKPPMGKGGPPAPAKKPPFPAKKPAAPGAAKPNPFSKGT